MRGQARPAPPGHYSGTADLLARHGPAGRACFRAASVPRASPCASLAVPCRAPRSPRPTLCTPGQSRPTATTRHAARHLENTHWRWCSPSFTLYLLSRAVCEHPTGGFFPCRAGKFPLSQAAWSSRSLYCGAVWTRPVLTFLNEHESSSSPVARDLCRKRPPPPFPSRRLSALPSRPRVCRPRGLTWRPRRDSPRARPRLELWVTGSDA